MDVAVTRRLRFALAGIGAAISVQPAHSEGPTPSSANTCRAHAPEAAMRSGFAVDVIVRVMRAESGGIRDVVSTKGAIGCMQIMPPTWAYLSQRYGLGTNPYDARMNMIGGALYLAELARRFGMPGAYSAYNAGPARYIRYAANGVPLPSETVAYATRLGGAAAPANAEIPRARWQEARLFLNRIIETADTGGMQTPRLAVIPDRAAASGASVAISHPAQIAATLFPLSSNAAPVQR